MGIVTRTQHPQQAKHMGFNKGSLHLTLNVNQKWGTKRLRAPAPIKTQDPSLAQILHPTEDSDVESSDGRRAWVFRRKSFAEENLQMPHYA